MSMSTVGGGAPALPQEQPVQAQGTPALPSAINQLPDELLISCLGFLDVKSLTTCSQVSWNWKALSSAEFLWKELVARVFPDYKDFIPTPTQDFRFHFTYLRECKKLNFTNIYSVEHAKLARGENNPGGPCPGGISFTIAEKRVWSRFLFTSNATDAVIDDVLTNINLFDFHEREDLARAMGMGSRSQPYLNLKFNLPQLIMPIGLASANVDTRNRFLQLKQDEDELDQERELEIQQEREIRRQRNERNAYQDGAFADFYQSDHEILLGLRQIDLGDYGMYVNRALSDGQHPNHQQYSKAFSHILRGRPLSEIPDNLLPADLNREIDSYWFENPVLRERCLSENPET